MPIDWSLLTPASIAKPAAPTVYGAGPTGTEHITEADLDKTWQRLADENGDSQKTADALEAMLCGEPYAKTGSRNHRLLLVALAIKDDHPFANVDTIVDLLREGIEAQQAEPSPPGNPAPTCDEFRSMLVRHESKAQGKHATITEAMAAIDQYGPINAAGAASIAPTMPAISGGVSLLRGQAFEVNEAIGCLTEPEIGVYQRSGALVSVTREAIDVDGFFRPKGAPTIKKVSHPRLTEILRSALSESHSKLANEVMARGEWHGIRPLDAIASYPIMRLDGSLLTTSGYDSATRTIAEIAIEVDVPDNPTIDDAREALALLADLVSDFPFVSDAARSAWLAALLTLPARPAIDGPTPMLLLEASQRGSGKTKLADLISIIVTGSEATRRTAPKTKEEWDKSILSILLAGDPFVLFDNVTTMLVSDALDAVLTGTKYTQRLLGVSEDARVAVRTVFATSANNARISTDLVRRTIGCRLEPDVENPEQRTNFKHADLLGHVKRERRQYLSAALMILRAYVVAGRPPVEARTTGSYEAWARVVRDALVWAGGTDPIVTQDELRESADVEGDEIQALLTAWFALLGDRVVTVRELLAATVGGEFGPGIDPALKLALADALRGVMPNGKDPDACGVGYKLRSMRGQIVGGLVLQPGKKARGDRATYTVKRVV